MNKIYKSPYDLVAGAIDIPVDTLNENSAMGVTYNWESMNHLHVIVAIETNYEIKIRNDEIMRYDNMKAIITLYKELSDGVSTSQKIIKFLKRIPVIKKFVK